MKLRFLKPLCFLVALLLATAAVNAQEIDSLRNEIKQLKQKLGKIDELELRLADLENDSSRAALIAAQRSSADSSKKAKFTVPKQDLRESTSPITGVDLIYDDFPGSWPMFGTEFRMKIGGYLKSDFIYDISGTNDKTQFLMSTIPVEGTPEHENNGYVNFISRESRFNIDVRRIKAGHVPLRLFIEGDFWSPGNQFRLRHAYIVAGNFLAGQTWTTLSILESLVFLIDFGAGDALFGGRTTQIRYQKRVNDQLQWSAALEMLDFMGIENVDNLPGKPSLGLPLLAVRADYHWKSGLLVLGSSLAQLRWDGGAAGPDAHGLQFDAVVAGRQYLGEDNYFTWNISGGVGSGENIMAFAGSQANAVLTPDGKLDTMPAFAFLAGFMHKWSQQLSSNLSFAYGWLDTPASRDPLSLKRGGISHVNVIWKPVDKFSAGVEYMWGTVRTTNDALGRGNRIQAMVKLDF